MLEGLYSAAAGMSAQQTELDSIGNDIANASTTGYQSERVAFSDLLYNRFVEAGTETSDGAGASARMIGRTRTQGAMRETGNPLDLAIEGDGYFQLTDSSGHTVLTRAGDFTLDSAGEIVDSAGRKLSPPIKLPVGVSAQDLRIGADGTVKAGTRTLGRIQLVDVASPDHLLDAGGGLLSPTADSGQPHAAEGAHMRQGALEDSNVNLGNEMAQMVTTQRAFQMTSTAIQTESQMMAIANQLRS